MSIQTKMSLEMVVTVGNGTTTVSLGKYEERKAIGFSNQDEEPVIFIVFKNDDNIRDLIVDLNNLIAQ